MTQDPTAGNDARDEQATAPTAAGSTVEDQVPGDPQASAGAGEQPAPGSAADADGTVDGGADADAGTAESADAEVERDLADAERQVAALTNDLQRLHAEYVNYKKRVDRDRELVLQNAKFSVLSSLLPVLDDVDRARAHGELEGGFKAVAEALEGVVASQGLVKFGNPGDEFDPRLHEALMHGHSPDVKTTTCQDIVSAGYMIGERVVRPARVTVVDPEPGDDTR
ncbi:MAG TPA: nucleotide exchange factor GrpE [Candidatus Limnocylindrales bacterium]|nr:nucleotide exchange factor GrpE [Candidatus Limnocylindrales bacterium]